MSGQALRPLTPDSRSGEPKIDNGPSGPINTSASRTAPLPPPGSAPVPCGLCPRPVPALHLPRHLFMPRGVDLLQHGGDLQGHICQIIDPRHDGIKLTLKQRAAGVPKATGRRHVSLHIVLKKGQRAGDLDSYFKSLRAALVHAGMLVDDNRQGVELAPVAFWWDGRIGGSKSLFSTCHHTLSREERQ
jgi:hypothetical protein